MRHAPHVVVRTLLSQEGDLTRDQARELTEKIWEDPEKRQFALDLMGTIVGDRKPGFENDAAQFPKLDLDLSTITTSTLLIHATADSDVPIDHSENALAQLPNAEILRVENGTHVSAWTDPDSGAIQSRIVGFLPSSFE